MTGNMIRICCDRTLSDTRDIMAAAERALDEEPGNVPVMPRARVGFGVAPEPTPFELAALTSKKWQKGRTLKVAFMDGDPDVQARVRRHAETWMQFANVNLDFGNHSEPEVRIAFKSGDGSWSYLGTDALTIPMERPTMNYGWLTPDTDESEYERVVVHEFGHALGCFHEHQHPDTGIPWDKEAVYAYYAGPPNMWARADVDHNLFRRYSRTVSQFSEFDPKSIMLYPVPNDHTVGDFEIGWNRGLSEIDKSFIGVMYPGAGHDAVALEVDGPPREASIGKHGEEDVFRLDIASHGGYVVETHGSTDVVMSLLGPEDEKALLAQDDDSGLGRNARIGQFLQPGKYWVRVRHFWPNRTGAYKIVARKVA